jgi:hypothetical protein
VFHTWNVPALVPAAPLIETVAAPVFAPEGTVNSHVSVEPTREAVAVLFEVPVKVTTALVTPVCVKRILSPITPPLTRADKFGLIKGIVFTNVTAALAGALIAFIGRAITAASTIDTIRKRFNSKLL